MFDSVSFASIKKALIGVSVEYNFHSCSTISSRAEAERTNLEETQYKTLDSRPINVITGT